MEKYHALKTVKQISDIVNEKNIECFLTDFRMFLEFQIQTRSMDLSKIVGMEGLAINEIKMGEVFRWSDDGKTGLTGVTVEITTDIKSNQPNK